MTADYHQAQRTWGANCGPATIAGFFDLPMSEVRALVMPEFARLGHVSRELMASVLERLGVRYVSGSEWPTQGIVSIRWMQACESGLARHEAYRAGTQGHWIGVRGGQVFDSYDACRWQDRARWEREVLPVLTGIERPEWPLWRVGVALTCS